VSASLKPKDVTPWPELFTDDGVQEFPYAPEGRPRKVEGKQAIAMYIADFPGMFELYRVNPANFYHDGDVVIAEFSADGRAVKTGNPYNQSYISVIFHKDGRSPAISNFGTRS